MTRIAILDDYQGIALTMADWKSLPDGCQVEVFHDHVADPAAVADRLGDYEIVCIMRERTPFRRDLLSRLPKLQLLVTTGMRNAAVDVEAASEQGVTVCGTAGSAHTTSELTWGLILALRRHIPAEDRAMKTGAWQTTIGDGLAGSTLGLLGLGRLGSEVARVGQAFRMNVIAWSQNLTAERAAGHGVTRVGRDELFRQSDVLSIHTLLSRRTQGLVGARELGLMKPSAVLVNTSRGPVVDEAALVDALQNRTIAGAGLDVFDTEPLPRGHPLRSLENAVLTPHLGYVTRDTFAVMYPQTLECVQAWLAGNPVRVISG
ncbi:MAG: D-2-hydroxyacid dehydrogenase family protein [Alphaproteobacteria bacterium]|nr:D-2-hydroxyacid dehydrogenase family protein [Alphaproteobacteria bacterium]